MKENDAGFIEKDRKHRDRSKKRRLTLEEQAATETHKPRMEPYHRETKKNWANQNDEE